MGLREELAATFLFERFDGEQLDFLVAHGEHLRFDEATVVFREGEPARDLYVLLEGTLRISRTVDGETVEIGTTAHVGSYAGATRAFSPDAQEALYVLTGEVLGPARLFRLPAPDFAVLMDRWFPMAVHLLNGLFFGLRNSEAMVRQREKLVALGTLSAGLAHELNNPAAAGRRSAAELRRTVRSLQTASTSLADTGIDAAALERLDALQDTFAARPAPPVGAPVLDAADREDMLGVWLDGRGVDDAWDLAPVLADGGLDAGDLDAVEGAVGKHAVGPALRLVADAATVRRLLDELEDATGRISVLVGAVKAYSYMDQAREQTVHVHDGVENTLVLLAHQLRGITVARDYDPELPAVEAYGGELNQVWTNLIDNAADAMDGAGTLTIRTARDGDGVLVEVRDTGPGIPPEIRGRIFDQFFTTKPVGQGTGLGLDVVRRVVVDRHRGRLDVASEPGDTRFTVRLPLRRPAPATS